MLIQPKQIVTRRAGMIGTGRGQVQPKQCVELGPTALTVGAPRAYYDFTNGSAQLGTTPLSSVGGEPTLTYGGTLLTPHGVYVKITATGTNTTAKFQWSDNNGTSYNGVDITAGAFTIPTTGTTLSFGAGTYHLGTVYQGVAQPIVDLSGNGFNFTNSTQPTRPFLFTQSHLNNLCGARFDGVDDRQVGPSGLATALCGGTDTPFMMTILCYLNAVPTGAGTACICIASSSTDVNLPFCELRMTSSGWNVIRRATGANSKGLLSGVQPSTGPHLLIWGFDGTNSFLRDNGVYVIGGDSHSSISGNYNQQLAAAITLNQMVLGARSIQSGTDEFCSMDLIGAWFHPSPPSTLGEIMLWEKFSLGM